MFWESIKMAWGNILHNKLRSFLTMLGIVIGVASVITLISIVQGATSSVTSQISALGADRLTVQIFGTPLKHGLSSEDFSAISAISHVGGVSPSVNGQTSVVSGTTVKKSVIVEGKNEVYFQKNADTLASGRVINRADVNSKNLVAVIGSKLARDLFFGDTPLGKKITVAGTDYTIIGILKPETGFSITSTNEAVLIPYTSAMRTLGVRDIMSIDVYMTDSSQSEQIVSDVKKVLNGAFNYHENTFNIFNMQEMISAIGNITGMMSLLLAGIAGISLIVGGIGIMNMMLVSVTERTTEIGLRKALGAEPFQIQVQFLIESVVISLFGGLIGLVFGLLLAFAGSKLIGVPFVMTGWTILLAVGFSAAIGVIFGLAPARKASRLNPIDALRHI